MYKRKVINNSHHKKTGLALSRRRTTNSLAMNDLIQSTMVPIMTVAYAENQVSYPDVELVATLQEICSSGRANQKQIAQDCKISSTKLSQFMNGATRKKGWADTELLLKEWLSRVVGNLSNTLQSSAFPDDDPNMESCVEEQYSKNTDLPETEHHQFQTTLLNPGIPEATEEFRWMQFSIGQALCPSV